MDLKDYTKQAVEKIIAGIDEGGGSARTPMELTLRLSVTGEVIQSESYACEVKVRVGLPGGT